MRLGRVLYYVTFSAFVLGATLFFRLPPSITVAYAGLAAVGMVLLLRDEAQSGDAATVPRNSVQERGRDDARTRAGVRAAGHEYDSAIASVVYLTKPEMLNFLWRFRMRLRIPRTRASAPTISLRARRQSAAAPGSRRSRRSARASHARRWKREHPVLLLPAL